MADQEKEILQEEMEQDLSDAEELKEEETEDEEPVSKEDKKTKAHKAVTNFLIRFILFVHDNTVKQSVQIHPFAP